LKAFIEEVRRLMNHQQASLKNTGVRPASTQDYAGYTVSLKRRIVMTDVKALMTTGLVMAAITYVVCAAFVAVAPDAASTLGTYVPHIDLNKVGRSVSWGGAAIGFVFVTAFVAIVCGASGAIYNRLAH